MDQRSAARRRVLKVGTIEFGGGALSCRVRDRSDTGAMLDVPSPIGIPDQFVLATDGSRIPCRVIWRKEKRIGIAFE
jgi:PilZ domain